MSYYVHRAGETFGPYSPETVVTMLRSRQLMAEDLAVQEGCEDWQPLSKIVDPGLLTSQPAPPPVPPVPAKTADDTERVFYTSAGATVTFSRFIIGSQTFAMRNISSVRLNKIEPRRAALIVVLIIGVLFSIGEETRFMGILLAFIAALVLFLQRPQFAIVLTASGGEVRALVSKEREWLSQIVAALNEAIIARG